MKIKDLLPIGTVVIMKDGEQPLMIYGMMQTDGNGGLFKKSKEYDYVCVPYPQGNMGEGSSFLINHEDIDKILFRGYDSEEREKFLDELSQMYNNQ